MSNTMSRTWRNDHGSTACAAVTVAAPARSGNIPSGLSILGILLALVLVLVLVLVLITGPGG